MKKLMTIAIVMIASMVFCNTARADSYFDGDLRYEVPGGESVRFDFAMCTNSLKTDESGNVRVNFSLVLQGCQTMYRFGFTEDNHIVLAVSVLSSNKPAFVLSRGTSKAMRDQLEHAVLNENVQQGVVILDNSIGRVESKIDTAAIREQQKQACIDSGVVDDWNDEVDACGERLRDALYYIQDQGDQNSNEDNNQYDVIERKITRCCGKKIEDEGAFCRKSPSVREELTEKPDGLVCQVINTVDENVLGPITGFGDGILIGD